jgi:hypothetical protein
MCGEPNPACREESVVHADEKACKQFIMVRENLGRLGPKTLVKLGINYCMGCSNRLFHPPE